MYLSLLAIFSFLTEKICDEDSKNNDELNVQPGLIVKKFKHIVNVSGVGR